MQQFLAASDKLRWMMSQGSYLNQGMGRAVFDIGDGKVLKVATKPFGTKQNEEEISTCSKFCKSGFFAQIFDSDQYFEWLIMEKVKTFNEGEFASTFGISEEQISQFINSTWNVEPNKEGFQDAVQITCKKYPGFVTTFNKIPPLGLKLLNVAFVLSAKYDVVDLDRHDHFGLTDKGKVVILDYGLGAPKYIDESNAIGSGAVSGAANTPNINRKGSPFDIDMKPQQKKLWSGDKTSSA